MLVEASLVGLFVLVCVLCCISEFRYKDTTMPRVVARLLRQALMVSRAYSQSSLISVHLSTS